MDDVGGFRGAAQSFGRLWTIVRLELKTFVT